MSVSIATDLFLICIKDFLDSIGEEKLAKKISSKIEHDVEIKEKYRKKFNLFKIMNSYLKQNEDLKKHLEKLTAAIIAVKILSAELEATGGGRGVWRGILR